MRNIATSFRAARTILFVFVSVFAGAAVPQLAAGQQISRLDQSNLALELSSNPDAGSSVLKLSAKKDIDAKVFQVTAPPRLVIDLKRFRFEKPGRKLSHDKIEDPRVENIRLFQLRTKFRIIVDLKAPNLDWKWVPSHRGGNLVIAGTGASSSGQEKTTGEGAAEEKELVATPALIGIGRSRTPEATREPSLLPSPAFPDPAASAPATASSAVAPSPSPTWMPTATGTSSPQNEPSASPAADVSPTSAGIAGKSLSSYKFREPASGALIDFELNSRAEFSLVKKSPELFELELPGFGFADPSVLLEQFPPQELPQLKYVKVNATEAGLSIQIGITSGTALEAVAVGNVIRINAGGG